MAWRKLFSVLILVATLSACTFPLEISFFQRETSVPGSKVLAPENSGQPGAASTQVLQDQPAAASEAQAQTIRYSLQAGTPVGVVNFVDPAGGCNWQGVGGQVFGLDAAPVTDLVAQLGGELGGNRLTQLAVTGGAEALGPGGYLIVLGDRPVASQGTLWLQLFDQQGLAVSDRVYFDTYTGCDRNLILINFAERFTVQSTNFLPLVPIQRTYYYFPFVGQR